MAKKAKPKRTTAPQFDADPLDEEEQPPFTLDDDGNMVLRRSARPPTKGVRRGKGKGTKPAR